MRSRVPCRCAAVLAALGALARCAAPGVPTAAPQVAALPAVPQDAAFRLRQQLRFEYAGSSGSVEMLVQVRCGELTAIGFAPFGARAFTLIQRGRELEVTQHLPGSWPFAPEYIARDIHRALLVPLPAEPPRNGERETVYGGERVLERWERGVLRRRVFTASGVEGSAGIVIDFAQGPSRGRPSGELRLENLRRGYVLTVHTLESRALRCPQTP